MMWTGAWDGWGAYWAMVLVMIVFWGGLIWMFGYAIRGTHSRETRAEGSSAMQILQERFARGEIDHEEFEERKRILGSKTG